MNSVIQKCVDELNKEKPNIDYVRGMLDTLLSMSGTVQVPITYTPTTYTSSAPTVSEKQPEDPEIELLETKTRLAMANMPPPIIE